MKTTAQLLLEADQDRPRSKQLEIGWSDLGDCRRRVGYKLRLTKPVNPSGSVQAAIGTAVHDTVADILRKQNRPGVLIEHPVTLAGISGHLDRYEDETVADAKTTSSRWLEHIKLHGPDRGHVWQASGYAAALIRQGRKVTHIEIHYLARDTGEEWVYRKPFDPADLWDAMRWLAEIRDTELDMLPRDHDPESTFCQGCPFGGPDGGICWEGHVPERHLRSVLHVEDPDTAKWADRLWELRQQIKALSEQETEAKQALDAVRPDEGGRVKAGSRTILFARTATPGKFQLRFVSNESGGDR